MVTKSLQFELKMCVITVIISVRNKNETGANLIRMS